MFRSQRMTRGLALVSGLAFLLTASVASAGPHHRHRAHHYRVVYHDDYCSARSDYRYDSYRGYERRHDSYTCGPCNRRFHSRRRFHHHLTSHHHVPIYALPFVIVGHALGWIFHG